MPSPSKKELESRLTFEQRKAAMLMVERELDKENRRTMQEVADEIGTSRQQLHRWKTKNTNFIAYMNALADDFLSSMRTTVYKRLMDTIDTSQPSVKAIDIYFRRHGLLTDRQVVETKDNAEANSNEAIREEIEETKRLMEEDDE